MRNIPITAALKFSQPGRLSVSVKVCASEMKEAANRGGLSVFPLYILGVEAIGHFECVI
jgi:hypothetical protein